MSDTPPRRPRIVIVGGGFGGLAAAKALRNTNADLILIDRRNHHLFQPLLYQVATAALSPAQIAQPIRAVLRKQKNADVILDAVTGIDTAAKTVLTRSVGPVPYDHLILATGASHAYFGHPEWEAFAPGLKSLDDATAIRLRVLDAFERAETARDEAERRALLTFVIIGAGPTGVEMAGAIAELAHRTLAREFRHIDTMSAAIVLIEAGPRVLAAMPEKLSAKALKALERLHVTVRLNTMVTACDAEGVVAGGQHLPCRTIIWAAGVQASPAAHWLGDATRKDRAGRVQVAPDLSVPGHPDIFVIGDTAAVTYDGGKPVPGIAPAAKQQGRYVARLLRTRIEGKAAPKPFAYRNQGNLATIGRGEAVVDLGRLKFSGALAWWFWGLVHIFFLIDFRNRISVSMDWFWSYLTFGRSARLIMDSDRLTAPLTVARPAPVPKHRAMIRPPHGKTPRSRPEKQGFWGTGFGTTIIFFAICLVCVPIYIGLEALGAISVTGFVVIFGGFWAVVFLIGWFIPDKPDKPRS